LVFDLAFVLVLGALYFVLCFMMLLTGILETAGEQSSKSQVPRTMYQARFT
jgi:hypothetical protein